MFKTGPAILQTIFLFAAGSLWAAHPVPMDTVGPDIFFFTKSDYYVMEDATNAWISVGLQPGSRSYSGSVNYATRSGGSATAPDDYTPVSGLLGISWPLVRSFAVPINSDNQVEGEETVLLTLSQAYSNSIIQSGSATLHIIDAAGGRISYAQPTNTVLQNEGPVTVRLNRTGGSVGAVTVQYRVGASYEGTTAVPGVDFEEASGSITFADGETVKTFDLVIHAAAPGDGDKSIRLFLADSCDGARLQCNVSTLVLTTHLPPPRLVISPGSGGLAISWCAQPGDYVLEKSSDFGASNWTAITDTPVFNNGECRINDSNPGPSAFYRLRKSP